MNPGPSRPLASGSVAKGSRRLETSDVVAPVGPLATLANCLTLAGRAHCLLWSGQRFGSLDPAAARAVMLVPGPFGGCAEQLAAAGFRPLRRRCAGPRSEHVALDPQRRQLVHLEVWSALPAADPPPADRALPWGERLAARAVADSQSPSLRVPDAEFGSLLLALWATAPEGPSARARGEFERLCPGGLALGAVELLADLAGDAAAGLLGDGPLDGRVHAALPLIPQEPAVTQAPVVAPGNSRPALVRGATVAFVGSDGAGKSSATASFLSFASQVLDTEIVYLGSGAGPSSWLRWPMVVVARGLQRLRPAGAAATDKQSSAAGQPSLRRRLRPVWALALAREKMQKLDQIERARERGALVVCDRFPQNEIMGFNDGPLLDGWRESSWRLLRYLSRWERRPYERAQANPPDLLVKLRVGEGAARARRPDMAVEELRRRIRALDELGFGAEGRTLIIDASAPLESVLTTIKCLVWDRI